MKNKIIQIITALILFLVGLLGKFENQWINNIIFILSYIIVGIEVLKEAIENIFKGEMLDEHFLTSIATIGAFAIGEFPEAVAVMLFYQIGEFFQDYAVDKSKKEISKLMDIRPDYANVYISEKIEKVKPEEVDIGQIIIVKPGEKIPLDGEIIEGSSLIDTRALTGESIPREAKIGEEVLSGCINLDRVIKIKVTKKYGESTVSKILDLIENASNKKSKSENFITKFAKYYTPIVVITALLLAIIPPLIIKDAIFSQWLYRALSFLVVSCPCALVISIPLSFFGGIGGASKMGILVKGGNYLEALSNAEIIVFDKTGTLTQGSFEVQEVESVNITEDELLKIVAYAENYSNHLIAKSVKLAYGNEIDESKISEIKELAGFGIEATIEGKKVLVGNEKLMNENKIEFSKNENVGTILYVAIEGKYEGNILISDKIKEDSANTIKQLRKSNKKVVMLTGDKKEVAEEVAAKLEITETYAELLPDGKVKKVEELMKNKSKKGKLAFVGDGINDSPVLALSDIGIAMGGLGSDSAIEAADIVIMTDEPSKIIDVIKLSKKTMRIVKENIIFSISIKIVVLILATLGLSTMWGAVFADVGGAIIATLNAMRALNIK